MLKRLKEIIGYRLRASDGEFGKVKDFFFDDHSWTVRYLVVDTGKWLPGQQVLISPVEVQSADWADKLLVVSLTTEQIKNSPGVETDMPISRKIESELASYYGWEPYWGTLGGPAMGALMPVETPSATATMGGDPHLRSVQECVGYHLQAKDGEIGHVDDFVAQTEDFGIRYMIVNTRNWLPGRKVLVSPAWVESFDWPNNLVHMDLTRSDIRNAPHFDPDAPLSREYEQVLHRHYHKAGYWEED